MHANRQTPQIGAEDPRAPTIAFVLVPQFSMIAFSTAVEPLRIANRLHRAELYRWLVLSPDGNPAVASNGIAVNVDAAIADFKASGDWTGRLDIVLVCGGLGSEQYKDPALSAWLRWQDRRGVRVGALCTGSSLLAAAGLLDGYKCVIHWESLPAFTATFPNIEVSADLFEVDRNRLTSAGGTASLDMMLHLIAEQHGPPLATQIAEQCVADRVRERHDHQRFSHCARLGIHNRKVARAIELMEANIEHPIRQEELAKYLGLSRRQLERLFRKYVGLPPSCFYLELRLKRARNLLLQSDMSILELALASGFASASHFSKCYRDLFAKTPREERQRAKLLTGNAIADGEPSAVVAHGEGITA